MLAGPAGCPVLQGLLVAMLRCFIWLGKLRCVRCVICTRACECRKLDWFFPPRGIQMCLPYQICRYHIRSTAAIFGPHKGIVINVFNTLHGLRTALTNSLASRHPLAMYQLFTDCSVQLATELSRWQSHKHVMLGHIGQSSEWTYCNGGISPRSAMLSCHACTSCHGRASAARHRASDAGGRWYCCWCLVVSRFHPWEARLAGGETLLNQFNRGGEGSGGANRREVGEARLAAGGDSLFTPNPQSCGVRLAVVQACNLTWNL